MMSIIVIVFRENRTFGKIRQKGVKWVKAKKWPKIYQKYTISDITHVYLIGCPGNLVVMFLIVRVSHYGVSYA